MNPGRKATRLGQDAIQPFTYVPHWLTPRMEEALRAYRLEYRLHCHASQSSMGGEEDPISYSDLFQFPGADPADVQILVDAVVNAAVAGYVNEIGGFRERMPVGREECEAFEEAVVILDGPGTALERVQAAWALLVQREQIFRGGGASGGPASPPEPGGTTAGPPPGLPADLDSLAAQQMEEWIRRVAVWSRRQLDRS